MDNLEKYFTPYCIKTVNNDTLLKKLPTLPIKTCPICNTRLKYRTSTGLTKQYCSNKCAYAWNIDKIKETNIEKYWVEYNILSTNNKEKTINTNIEKYWVDNPFKSEVIKDKIKETNIEKYWVDNPSKSKLIRDKVKETNIERYWFNSHLQSQEIKNKIKETNIERYWNENWLLHSDKAKETRILNIIKKQNYFNWVFNINVNPYSYIYLCDDCSKISEYITKEQRDFILQRFRFKTNPCNHCSPREEMWVNKRSWLEKKLEILLNEIWIKTTHTKDIDIFLSDYNIWIEINWSYWHSDKFKSKYKHRDKILSFKEKWIQLLCFSDIDIENNMDRVINYIKWKIGLLPSIWASKCKIREIKSDQARTFCDKYHIHWYTIGSKNYWMFLKDELVSVCIVWKNRFNKDDSIEIIRLCNSNKIIWWFARFLKLIKKDYPNKDIVTFINTYLWLSDNNIFTKNWFEYVWLTEPNYYWVLNWNKISRYKAQQKDEDKNMRELWAYKVYDWWNYKFYLTNK